MGLLIDYSCYLFKAIHTSNIQHHQSTNEVPGCTNADRQRRQKGSNNDEKRKTNQARGRSRKTRDKPLPDSSFTAAGRSWLPFSSVLFFFLYAAWTQVLGENGDPAHATTKEQIKHPLPPRRRSVSLRLLRGVPRTGKHEPGHQESVPTHQAALPLCANQPPRCLEPNRRVTLLYAH